MLTDEGGGQAAGSPCLLPFTWLQASFTINWTIAAWGRWQLGSSSARPARYSDLPCMDCVVWYLSKYSHQINYLVKPCFSFEFASINFQALDFVTPESLLLSVFGVDV